MEKFAVVPYADCSGCSANLAVFDALTGVSSHELYEAITDPVSGQGWYDQNNGEIGDTCAWQAKQVGSYYRPEGMVKQRERLCVRFDNVTLVCP